MYILVTSIRPSGGQGSGSSCGSRMETRGPVASVFPTPTTRSASRPARYLVIVGELSTLLTDTRKGLKMYTRAHRIAHD
jgi:hypothetical protein